MGKEGSRVAHVWRAFAAGGAPLAVAARMMNPSRPFRPSFEAVDLDVALLGSGPAVIHVSTNNGPLSIKER